MTGTIEAIYRQHRNGLFTLALSITGFPESAEDAVHEAITRLLQMRKTPAGDAVAYVFAAVRNASLDQRRRQSTRRGRAISIFEIPEPAVAEISAPAFEAQERTKMIDKALQALPIEQSEAVIMHLYTGLTFAQAGEVLGVPLQTLAARYRRGIDRLRESLAIVRDEFAADTIP